MRSLPAERNAVGERVLLRSANMRKPWMWMFVCLIAISPGAGRSNAPSLPELPPYQKNSRESFDRVVRLEVEYDETFLEQHGDSVEDVITEAIAIHNMEWRRYRREWFVLGGLRFHPSESERDATYVLARFTHRTVHEPDTIHVNILGRQLEVYSNGRGSTAIGGLAYRGSDALLVSVAPGAPTQLIAYYLFHELGHAWDALDLPFRGGDSTYGAKSKITFDIDAGNEEVMEHATGPGDRTTRGRAPMLIRAKLADAWRETRDTTLYPRLHELLLHEPSPSNPAYLSKKETLLAAAGEAAPRIEQLIARYEVTRKDLRDDAETRQQIAQHYWRANDALANGDLACAAAEIETVKAIYASTPDVHFLVGAVEKKIQKKIRRR